MWTTANFTHGPNILKSPQHLTPTYPKARIFFSLKNTQKPNVGSEMSDSEK